MIVLFITDVHLIAHYPKMRLDQKSKAMQFKKPFISLLSVMKWKRIILVCGLWMIAGSLAAQHGRVVEWARQFGTAGDETVLEVSVYGTDVYVCGKVEGALPGQTHFGSSDAFVRKYNIFGREEWTRQFGTDGYSEAKGISVDASGVYVCGRVGGCIARSNASGFFP